MNKPIFLDATKKRWKIFQYVVKTSGVFLSVGFLFLLLSIVFSPKLPDLHIPILTAKKHISATSGAKISFDEKKREIDKERLLELNNQIKKDTAQKTGKSDVGELLGFVVNWEDTSFTSLKAHLDMLDTIAPEWLQVTKDASIVENNTVKQERITTYIQTSKPTLRVLPLINNYLEKEGVWDTNSLHLLFTNEEKQQQFLTYMTDYIVKVHGQGITLDIENIPEEDMTLYVSFVKKIVQTLHTSSMLVYVTVPALDESFPYDGLLDAGVDKLILMAYDEHWSSGEAGPIASQLWFEKVLSTRLEHVSGEKYIIALANYAYDWKDKAKTAASMSFQDAITVASESEGEIAYDPESLNPTYDYYDEENALHHVWLLDATTAFNELKEVQAFGAAGVALWRLGGEDPSIWNIFSKNTVPVDPSVALSSYKIGYDISYTGSGEILKVVGNETSGKRSIEVDEQHNLITNSEYSSFPIPFQINRWGGAPTKKIVLTFDDGPDPVYTPAILDVLKKYHVPATFFVVGTNAENQPDLLRRIVSEGHEVGSHTYFHPNIAEISSYHLTLELNTVQRLLESLVGKGTLLFRPPYAEDLEPETPDQVEPTKVSSDLGYYTIGMHIDPTDWGNVGVDTIVQRIYAQAESGNNHIILLHDAGGDRRQTVEALPLIIEKMQKEGYEFTTVADLLGVDKDTIMPPVVGTDRIITSIDEGMFSFVYVLGSILSFLFFLGVILGLFRFLLLLVLALIQYFRSEKFTSSYCPTVSIIIPAYNEGKVVNKTIASVAHSDYPALEIVVVDDGSTDNTFDVAQKFSQDFSQVRVFTKENGGKSSAINFGIQNTHSDIIVVIDADTLFALDTIPHLVRHFVDPKVGAVAGNVKVGNRATLLTKWQAIEYITSQNIERRAFDLCNAITVVPGAIGAWRRDVLLEVGGFTHDTLAEDADVTMKILKKGYVIRNEADAHAFTESPESLRGFLKQRFRWSFGTMQVAWKHKNALFRPSYGGLGMFALPNIILFQIFFPLLSPIVDFTMIVTLLSNAYEKYFHPFSYNSDTLIMTGYFYAVFLLIDFCTALLAFFLEKKEEWRLLPWIFLQRLVYRQLMYYVLFQAIFSAIRGHSVGWGNIERKGTVHL